MKKHIPSGFISDSAKLLNSSSIAIWGVALWCIAFFLKRAESLSGVPEVVIGQSQGGFAMGVGYALLETLPPVLRRTG
ncbi:hypothetical protein [Granulicella sp. dw_53]|uniref:hypothetical protein n=1 Tax=Granulicella sp. dw_53 TaxID=2719792 RepID=UPI001BD32A85|nr:hypothetical protein [Granulicella sp. dw_53]